VEEAILQNSKMTGALYFALFRYYMLKNCSASYSSNICRRFDDSLLATRCNYSDFAPKVGLPQQRPSWKGHFHQYVYLS